MVSSNDVLDDVSIHAVRFAVLSWDCLHFPNQEKTPLNHNHRIIEWLRLEGTLTITSLLWAGLPLRRWRIGKHREGAFLKIQSNLEKPSPTKQGISLSIYCSFLVASTHLLLLSHPLSSRCVLTDRREGRNCIPALWSHVWVWEQPRCRGKAHISSPACNSTLGSSARRKRHQPLFSQFYL